MNKSPANKEHTFLKLFNYLGGMLIFLGIGYFIVDNWNNLNNFIRVFTTLGAAIIAFVVGILYYKAKKEASSAAFFMLSALLLPIGLQVSLTVAHVSWNENIIKLFISGICLAVFLSAQYLAPRTIFLLFTIIYASLFYLSVLLFNPNSTSLLRYLDNYDFIILGISYISLGYYLANENQYPLAGPLYFFGALFVLAESFSLGDLTIAGYVISQWEIFTPILIIAVLMLAIPLSSKSFLYLGAIFLLLYLGDLATKLIPIFGDTGWSLLLIVLGLLMMMVGYLVIFLRKKMLVNKHKS